MPTKGGLVNPAAEIGAASPGRGVPYLLDACQSVGQMPIDVGEIGCDMLSATGRKFLRGPRGTGFLYVRRTDPRRLEPPFLDLHAAEWTAPRAYVIRPTRGGSRPGRRTAPPSSGSAQRRVRTRLGLEAIAAAGAPLAAHLRSKLGGRRELGARSRVEQCGIVTFTVDGVAAQEVAARLGAARSTSPSPGRLRRLDFGSARPRRRRPRVRPLLQHRGRGGPARGSSSPGWRRDGEGPCAEPRAPWWSRTRRPARARAPRGAARRSAHAARARHGTVSRYSRSGTRSPATRSCSRPASSKVRNLRRDPRATVVLHDSRRAARCAGRRSGWRRRGRRGR